MHAAIIREPELRIEWVNRNSGRSQSRRLNFSSVLQCPSGCRANLILRYFRTTRCAAEELLDANSLQSMRPKTGAIQSIKTLSAWKQFYRNYSGQTGRTPPGQPRRLARLDKPARHRTVRDMPSEHTHLHLFDAHNHLHDERLAAHLEEILPALTDAGIRKMVVNGSCESDWPAVLELSKRVPQVIPSFGYHPWYVRERTAEWKEALVRHVDAAPAAIGEIGLDRWVKDHDLPLQEEMFVWQMRLAAERNLPVSIHCLQAWGRLLEILKAEPRPDCGFVLHSFGGPKEMIPSLAELGAYFSLPGYFAHERKGRQRETFKHVPRERLLIETDAPDQSLPNERVEFPLPAGADGKPVNHPANLKAVYQFAAELRGEPVESLAQQVETNFRRLFGRLMRDV
jgi:TatD DNase family protein